MNRRIITLATAVCTIVTLTFFSSPVEAQKKGQAISIQHGKVVKIEEVKTDTDAGKGALVGGTIGLLTASGKSGKRKRRDAAIGAAVGAGATRAVEGSRKALAYTVETPTGAISVVSDQTQIKKGDCVSIEQSGDRANIRRVSQEVCDPEAADVLPELQEEFVEEAEECIAAKAQLVAAETDEAIDRAISKVHILCDS